MMVNSIDFHKNLIKIIKRGHVAVQLRGHFSCGVTLFNLLI